MCGLDEHGTQLFTGSLTPTAYTQTSRFDVFIPVQAWRALQWDGVGRPEFAVQTALGMMVFTHVGGYLLSAALPLTSTNPLLHSYHDAALGADRLVWSTNSSPAGNNLIYQLDNRFPTYEPPLNLGSFVPAAFALADWNGADSNDLVVAEAGGAAVRIFAGQSGAAFPNSFAHDDQNLEAIVFNPGIASGKVHLNVADLDLDGDDDIFMTHDDLGSYLQTLPPAKAPRTGSEPAQVRPADA